MHGNIIKGYITERAEWPRRQQRALAKETHFYPFKSTYLKLG